MAGNDNRREGQSGLRRAFAEKRRTSGKIGFLIIAIVRDEPG
jgi:hypothetical protein